MLDFRAGTLTRRADWVSPAGRRVRVSSVRMVSFTQRSIARDQLPGRVARRPGPRGGAVRAGHQRGAAAARRGPPGRRGARGAAGVGGIRHHGRPGRADAPDQAQRPDGVGRHAARGGLRRGHPHLDRGPAGPGPAHRGRPAPARATAPAGEVRGLRLVGHALPACPAGPGGGRAHGGRADGLGRPGRGAAGLPGRFLGPGRCGARGRRGDPAGDPLRDVPRAAGRRPRGGPAHPGQGPVRERLRRPLVLGRRDVRAARAHLHHPGRRGPRAALAAEHPARRPRPGRPARPERCRLPVAHDHRRRVLGVLAGRDRRVPRERGHRARRRRVRAGDRRRSV